MIIHRARFNVAPARRNRIAEDARAHLKRSESTLMSLTSRFWFAARFRMPYTAATSAPGVSRSRGASAKGKETHLRGELKAFVAFRRSSSQHPSSSFTLGRRILLAHIPSAPAETQQSLVFTFIRRLLARRARPRFPSSAVFRRHPGPPRIHIPSNRCLTPPPPPPLPHHPQVVNTRTDASLTHTRAWKRPRSHGGAYGATRSASSPLGRYPLFRPAGRERNEKPKDARFPSKLLSRCFSLPFRPFYRAYFLFYFPLSFFFISRKEPGKLVEREGGRDNVRKREDFRFSPKILGVWGRSAINRGACIRGTETLRHLPKGAPRETSTSCESRRAAAMARASRRESARATTPPPVARRCAERRRCIAAHAP